MNKNWHIIYDERIKGEGNIETFCHIFYNNLLHWRSENPPKDELIQNTINDTLSEYAKYGILVEKENIEYNSSIKDIAISTWLMILKVFGIEKIPVLDESIIINFFIKRS